MAKLIALGEARGMNLPGRRAREIVGAIAGAANSTVRLVEIDPDKPGAKPRGPHVHHGFEECIHVLAGEGVTRTENGEYRVSVGDTDSRVPLASGTPPTTPVPACCGSSASFRSTTLCLGQRSSRPGTRTQERDDARRALPSS